MNPISRGDGLDASVEARLRRFPARGSYCQSNSFSSTRVLADEGEVMVYASCRSSLLSCS